MSVCDNPVPGDEPRTISVEGGGEVTVKYAVPPAAPPAERTAGWQSLVSECRRTAGLGRELFLLLGPVHLRPPARVREHCGPRPRTPHRRRSRARTCARSGDSTDDGPHPQPPFAVCPVCVGLCPEQDRCAFCGGLGFVNREARNRYKRSSSGASSTWMFFGGVR